MFNKCTRVSWIWSFELGGFWWSLHSLIYLARWSYFLLFFYPFKNVFLVIKTSISVEGRLTLSMRFQRLKLVIHKRHFEFAEYSISFCATLIISQIYYFREVRTDSMTILRKTKTRLHELPFSLHCITLLTINKNFCNKNRVALHLQSCLTLSASLYRYFFGNFCMKLRSFLFTFWLHGDFNVQRRTGPRATQFAQGQVTNLAAITTQQCINCHRVSYTMGGSNREKSTVIAPVPRCERGVVLGHSPALASLSHYLTGHAGIFGVSQCINRADSI